MVMDWEMVVSTLGSFTKILLSGATILFKWNTFVMMQPDKQRMRLISVFPAVIEVLTQQISTAMVTACLMDGKYTIDDGSVLRLPVVITGL